VTERYAYNEAGQLIGEYGTSNRDYLWLGDLPVAVIDNTINGSVTTSTVNYVTADQLGTPRAVTDSTGTVIWSWAYQGNPFGEQQPTSTTGYVLNLRYPGQYYDAESGLNYNVNRDYEASTGRYLQSDPIGLRGGTSTFLYSDGDAINLFDDTGLNGKKAVAWANKQVGKPGYGYFDQSVESRGRLMGLTKGSMSYKCNKFVWDALKAGGDPAGRMSDGRIPSASEWGNPKSNILGYISLPPDLPLIPGDVVGNGHHVALYDPSSAGDPLTVSAAAPLTGGTGPNGGVVNNDWGYRSGDELTAHWRSDSDVSPVVNDPALLMGLMW
jgi:RHS repeat-associated protein